MTDLDLYGTSRILSRDKMIWDIRSALETMNWGEGGRVVQQLHETIRQHPRPNVIVLMCKAILECKKKGVDPSREIINEHLLDAIQQFE